MLNDFLLPGAEIGTTDSTLISIDSSSYVPTASKRLWAFAQWSRYVRPGAVRLGTSAATGGLSFSAFKNTDGTLSVQVINSGTTAQSVTVATCGYTPSTAVAYVSAQGTDLGSLSITFSNGQATGSAPAHSMITFVLEGSFTSTGSCTPSGGGTSTSSTSGRVTSTSTSSGGGSTACSQTKYGQCGGTCQYLRIFMTLNRIRTEPDCLPLISDYAAYTGCTVCSGSTCTYSNPCECSPISLSS